jgi:hypothetical protein
VLRKLAQHKETKMVAELPKDEAHRHGGGGMGGMGDMDM